MPTNPDMLAELRRVAAFYGPDINGEGGELFSLLHDAADALEAAFARSSTIEDGWRPIESAPKDGTEIDLFVNGFRWVDCRWLAESDCFPNPRVGWYSQQLAYGDGDWFDDDDVATHWMPLPKAPTDD